MLDILGADYMRTAYAKGLPEQMAKAVESAQDYGLRIYACLHTKKKFPKDDPIFKVNEEIFMSKLLLIILMISSTNVFADCYKKLTKN